MRRLVFATQKLDPSDPVLAATVPMVRALAARVDELVVLCDSAEPSAVPANARVHEFGAPTQVQRGARFLRALERELRPRPLGVVAHMVPLYAVLAAPLVRPRRLPLVLWFTHWKGHAVVRAAERLCTAVASVDERSFPLRSAKVHAIGHGIDVSEFACADAPHRRDAPCGRARPLLAGKGARDDPARRPSSPARRVRGARLGRDVEGVPARARSERFPVSSARRSRAARRRCRRSSRAATCS